MKVAEVAGPSSPETDSPSSLGGTGLPGGTVGPVTGASPSLSTSSVGASSTGLPMRRAEETAIRPAGARPYACRRVGATTNGFRVTTKSRAERSKVRWASLHAGHHGHGEIVSPRRSTPIVNR